MIEINYFVIVGLAIFSMALGAVWYGPLFGKKWMRINGIDPNNVDQVKQMGKGVGKLYGLQLLLTLFLTFVLYVYTKPAADVMSEVSGALWLWAGFVVPILASAVMWTTESKANKVSRFLIQAGFNLIYFMVAGAAIMLWG